MIGGMKVPSDTPASVYSLRETAERAGVSVSTVRRRRSALEDAGAVCGSEGWAVPQSAIDAVFGNLPDTPADTPADTPTDTPADTPANLGLLRALGDQIDHLQAEVLFLREQSGVKDEQIALLTRTLADEARARAVIDAQRVGLAIEGTETPADESRPGFWRRLFGR